jgi:hypothetical protein
MDLYGELKDIGVNKVEEAFRMPTEDEIRRNIAQPDFKPNQLDVSLESWLKRLEYWGKLEIKHTNPEVKIKKKRVTKKQFLDAITDDTLVNTFGRFQVKDGWKFNEVIMYREYKGLTGKKNKEKYSIVIDFYPEVKKKMKRSWF